MLHSIQVKVIVIKTGYETDVEQDIKHRTRRTMPLFHGFLLVRGNKQVNQ